MSTAASSIETVTITVGSGDQARQIATQSRRSKTEASGPALMWLGGYRSDMAGTKAIEMDRLADTHGLAAIRFDYSGHGQSGGDFKDGTISRWTEEALSVLDHEAPESVILIGSSMGGWIALRLIEEIRRRGNGPEIEGLVLIAPAPDFTIELIEPQLTDTERHDLAEKGYFEEISEYSPDPNIFTRKLFEDGEKNRVLKGIVETGCPVHILQGMNDPDVPYTHALKLLEHLPSDDVVLTLIRDGDHRLSRPQDLERMTAAIEEIVQHC
ncbi:alpha/beta hydrolase [Agrobacterium sp. ES01]|uniref:alpha/beta hydrolase n=1 Tax=Agrobacterium sp. ES01 TaxID=3420714 RepID=UPI003D149883